MVAAERLTLASAAIPFEHDPARNLDRCCETLREAAGMGADIVLLPEQVLQGYLPTILRFDQAAVRYQQQHAERVPGGAALRRLVEHVRALRIYAIVGVTERADDEATAVLYNTAVVLGPDGYIGKYRKTHQPGCEGAVYWPGNEITTFDLPFGRIGVLVCYDKWFVEPVRELALMRADFVFVMSACCLERPDSDPATDSAVDTYALLDRVRAFENQVWLVTANAVGPCGDEQYFGQARIVNPDGRIVAETAVMKEGIAIATVDGREALVRARAQNVITGLDMLRHRRPRLYRHLCG